MPQTQLIYDARLYVTDILSKLPETICFHNLMHTENVFNAVEEIGDHEGVSAEDMELVQVAALFHDTGYLYNYTGHEEVSVFIAGNFLTQKDCSPGFIDKVSACIKATKMPQQPGDLLEQIICDADFFHFALENYPDYAAKLRKEWTDCLHKTFTDNEWNTTNLKVLLDHSYFTGYGKSILQSRKQKNINKLVGQSVAG